MLSEPIPEASKDSEITKDQKSKDVDTIGATDVKPNNFSSTKKFLKIISFLVSLLFFFGFYDLVNLNSWITNELFGFLFGSDKKMILAGGIFYIVFVLYLLIRLGCYIYYRQTNASNIDIRAKEKIKHFMEKFLKPITLDAYRVIIYAMIGSLFFFVKDNQDGIFEGTYFQNKYPLIILALFFLDVTFQYTKAIFISFAQSTGMTKEKIDKIF